MSKPTVLVLGASGITGRRIAAHLAERAIVRAVGRTTAIPFDWNVPETHGPALAGADAIYLVPPPFVAEPSAHVARLLAAAQRAGVRRVVAVTSLAVTFPTEPASSGRIALERAITSSGLEWTLLRPGGFAQNFSEGFLRPGVDRGLVVSATGTGQTAMIDADDIARVAAIALLDPGHAGAAYALTGPEPLTFAAATEVVARAAHRPIEYRGITDAELAGLLAGFGLPPDYAAIVVRDQRAIREGAGAIVSGDVERVTGRAAASFAEAAARMAW